MKQQIDYLIIGQGLAGSCIAWELIKAKKTIHLFASSQYPPTSPIAAGLYAPLTGKQRKVTPSIADRVMVAIDFYQSIETELQKKWLFPTSTYQLIKNNHPSIAKNTPWLSPVSTLPSYIQAAEGAVEIKQSGYLNTAYFLEGLREHFKQKNLFFPTAIQEEKLLHRPEGVYHQDHLYKKVIFCQGVHVINSTIWAKIGHWQPVAGAYWEIILDRTLPGIYKGEKVFIMPGRKPNTAYIGASYLPLLQPERWEELNQQLLLRAVSFFHLPYQIKQLHQSIRPATMNRKPLLCQHPAYNHYWICNGLGSKGVTYAPFLAKLLVAALLSQKPLPDPYSL